MKKSLIWITAGIAAVGFGVPAFAAHGDSPSDITPAPTQVTVARATPVTVSDDNVTTNSIDDNVSVNSATVNSVPVNSVPANGATDISGPCDEAEHANDPRCTGVAGAVTEDSVDDNVTTNSAPDNSVADISGPCDEAEHANDPRCTGVATGNDDSGHDGSDDSGHGRGSNDD